MPQAEESCQHVDHALNVLLPRLSVNADMRGARLRCEGDRLFHCESRKMHVILGAVLNVATVRLLNFGWGEGVVINVSLYTMIFAAVIGQDLEQGTASSTRTSEND